MNGNSLLLDTNTVLYVLAGDLIQMAIGQFNLQTGGKNHSSIHWDMITDMRNGGEILADGELIYRDGKFIFSFQ